MQDFCHSTRRAIVTVREFSTRNEKPMSLSFGDIAEVLGRLFAVILVKLLSRKLCHMIKNAHFRIQEKHQTTATACSHKGHTGLKSFPTLSVSSRSAEGPLSSHRRQCQSSEGPWHTFAKTLPDLKRATASL